MKPQMFMEPWSTTNINSISLLKMGTTKNTKGIKGEVLKGLNLPVSDRLRL